MTSITAMKYQDAYQNDKFAEYERQSRKIRAKCHMTLDTLESGLTIFETILSSHDEHAPKYISFLLRRFELWDDDKFLHRTNQHGKTAIYYAAQSKNAGNLISFLMYDWYNPERNPKKLYHLVTKSEQFQHVTGEDLLSRLYQIIDDDSATVFRDVCLRIIYQYFSEVKNLNDNEARGESDDDSDSNDSYDSDDSSDSDGLSNIYCTKEKNEDKGSKATKSIEDNDALNYWNIKEFGSIERVLSMNNAEYQEKILEIIVVFWERTEDNNDEYTEYKNKILSLITSETSRKYFELVFLLKESLMAKFEQDFKDYVRMTVVTILRRS